MLKCRHFLLKRTAKELPEVGGNNTIVILEVRIELSKKARLKKPAAKYANLNNHLVNMGLWC